MFTYIISASATGSRQVCVKEVGAMAMMKLKALRAMALLTAVGAASALLVSMGSAPAKASEERLHNESFNVYGLIPPTRLGASQSSAEGGHKDSAAQPVSFAGTGPSLKGKGGKGDEPGIEDPPLPGYDGDATSNASASASR
jgi:hypothetical protein